MVSKCHPPIKGIRTAREMCDSRIGKISMEHLRVPGRKLHAQTTKDRSMWKYSQRSEWDNLGNKISNRVEL